MLSTVGRQYRVAALYSAVSQWCILSVPHPLHAWGSGGQAGLGWLGGHAHSFVLPAKPHCLANA